MVKVKNSLSTKLLSMLLAMSILLGVLPPTMLSVFAIANTHIAQIGDTYYETLADAIEAVSEGENCVTPSEATEIKLLTSTAYGFDVGKSNGSVTKNISLDLCGNTLTLMPAVGSMGTTSNGIRVLAYSKLAISNGIIVCSDDTESNIKTGIANYGELSLDNVELKSGALTIYTINNRGKLTLSGNTSVENGRVEQTPGEGDYIAITNDPYNLYYTTNVDAALICDSADVSVGTVQIERYERTSSNKGVVKLDISNGTFDRIIEDGNSSVNVSYDLTGGTIGVYNDTELKNALNMITPGAEYTCPEKAVTIKLLGDGTFAHGFDVGTSNGKAPKNIVLDLNGKSLTLNPAVGSTGTVSNGVRVLAYSKLHIKSGALICPDETEANIKTGIANYSDLTLEDVTVQSGALTQYTINNRGKLTLLGATKVENGQVAPNDYADMMGELVAITNDPYTTYNTSNENNASLVCDSADVVVGNLQLECYGNVNKNIILDISNGTFGKVFEPETTGNVAVDGSQITGGIFESDVSDYVQKTEYSVTYDSSTETYKVNTLIEVTDFAFETPIPLNQWVGTSYTNVAKSQTSTGTVTYKITAGTDVAEIDESTGEVTFKKLGTITVTATLAQTDTHKSATAEYTVTSVKIAQDVLSFPISAPAITYNPNELTFTNEASGGSGTGKITYEIISGSEYATVDKDTGVVTIIKAGQVTIQATKEADGQYNANTTTYVLTINPAYQADLVVDAPASITYIKDTPQSVLNISGGTGNGDVTYSIISGSEFATIDANTGKITTIKASETAAGVCGIITVRVDKAGDDCYNAATPVTKDIIINFADQTGFDFEITDADKLVVTYNDSNNKFINKASGGQSTGTISYEITGGTNVADINAETGELTIKQAGQVTVKAVKSGDTCYNAVQATYTLAVNPDSPEFTVNDIDLIYGVQEYQINVNTELGGSGNYVYSIEDANNIGASVDDNGKITFENSIGKVGSIIVKVKKEADNQYKELEKSFTLTVSYHAPAAQPTVSGSTKNESGWYTGIVTITAPDEYQISYSNDLTGTIWSDTVTVNTDGVNSKNVYLKKGNEISDAISFESIKVDTAAPTNVKIDYSKTFFEKTLETITFGIYEAKTINVTLTATDVTSGVDYFTYDIGNGDVVVKKSDFTKNENGVAEYTFQISAEFRNKVRMSATDVAGWTSELTETEHVLVIDSSSPLIVVKYDFTGSSNILDTIYANNNVTVKFEIEDENFSLRAADPVFMVGSMKIELTWEEDKEAGVWKAEQLLSGDNTYNLSLTFSDASGNEMNAYVQTIIIDSEAPIISSNYGATVPVKENIFNKDRTAEFTITESNFNASEVVLTVTAKDITGADVNISSKAYAEYVKNPANWKYKDANGEFVTDVSQAVNADEYYIVLPKFDIDAIYSVKLEYADLADNPATPYTADFVIDKTNPTNIDIEYSKSIVDKVLETITFGFYKSEVTVTITADDITSGVDFFTWSYTQEENTSSVNKTDDTQVISKENITYSNNGKTAAVYFVIEAQARGHISVDVTDNAGNSTSKTDENNITVVVDNIDPTRTIEFSDARVLDRATMTDVTTYVEGDDVILYYENEAEVTITVNEANFYAEDVVVTLTKNGTDSTPEVVWTDESADKHIGKFTISGDGDYFVKVTYIDRSGNEMEVYNSQEIRIDNTDPTTSVEYSSKAEAVNVKYYKEDCKAVITIVDHNFLSDDVVAVVTAVDVQNNKIANEDAICAEFAAYLKNRSSWSHVGDVHTAEITFDDDAQYTFKIDYKDIIGNTAQTYVADPFVVDHKEPTNLKIEYSKPIVDKIIETITFGFYKSEVTVTITADDITSGVDYFDWGYTKEEGSSDKNTDELGARIATGDIEYSNDGLSAKATFKVPANARGYITATVTDRAGNSTSKTDKNNITVVVDNIAPTIAVNYEAHNTDTKVQFTDDNHVTVDTFADADYAYYNGDVTAKIVINEANFFEGVQATDGVIHNVGIKLTKTDDNGNITVYEYLTTGAVQKYTDATPKYITWTTSGDEHSFNINYADNADYVLEIEYTDLSTNDASISANDGNNATKSYKSKVVTVDKIAPAVDVKYSNEKIIHTIDGRDYFDAEQTATITVQEHNFRADDFVATVIAKDILNADVNVENFKATLSDDSKWTKNGNTYTITIKYSVDANYSFDYEYEDLAQNTAVAYNEDIFTVDKTAPKNLTVSYSQSIADKVLETITFGYYNSKVTVTITAEDDTAGIHRFEYAYLKSEGVSSVNAELLKAAIEEAEFKPVEGKKYTATFEIPKDVLKSENQFNGTVKFVAFDRAENNTEMADTRRVIVDNIAPTATITYNAPEQNANDISYYAGNIDAKIVINEANFYSEDVVVKVNNKVVAVKWIDDSVDVHRGTFTLTEEGDYIVTVEYKDRSDNEMLKYTSNRLTIDTKAPTVNVTNIKQSSANKDEKYGFTITANDDIKLDTTSFKPVLTATIRKDDGSYGTKTVPLGEMKIVEIGKTYAFTVDNLEEDAIYSLVCTFKDMSGNEYSKITLSDGKEYEEVRFSINRNGSTFAVDNNTDTLVNQYYVYGVDEDVVIEEVNVDPVETYVVKLNGEALTEGTDYTSTLSDKAGEWSKRTYIISKDLFKSEGEYSIVVESTDKAESTAYSDVKNLNVSFVVDQTAPVLTISGLENGGRYQVEEQTVTVIPTDDGGRLYSIKVVVLDSDGEPLKDANGKDISVRFEMSGEEFLSYLTENNGKITFTVPEGLENQVQIICKDYAVNADGKTNEYNETFTKVTVSQSGWIIFYANKPLFYGSIAGALLLGGSIIFLIFLKKRKKEAK